MSPWSRSVHLLLAALVTLTVSGTAGAGCLLPHWEQVSSIERAADDVLAIDVDGDEKPDVVGYTSDSIFVARNQGGGVLAAPVDLFTGTVSGNVVAADVNGDGKLDLVFGGISAITVLPAAGGTFGAAIVSPVTITPTRLAVAPFEEGAAPDVIASDAALSVAAVFTNDGSGRFIERSRTSLAAKVNTILAADLDRDGRTDWVLAYGEKVHDAFYGRPDRSFGTPVPIHSVAAVGTIRASDMNGDGMLDLVVGTYWSLLATIRNLGGRSFGDPINYAETSSVIDLRTAEVTGDAALDAISGSDNCTFRTWSGSGIGTFTRSWTTATPGCYSAAVKLDTADFDGDGRTDVVVSKQRFIHVVNVYRNRCGDSTITASAIPVISAGEPLDVSVRLDPPVSRVAAYPPTGSMAIRADGNVLARATMTSFTTSVRVENLAIGTHTLVPAYEGDAQYEAHEGRPLAVAVTSETTSPVITVEPPNSVYGVPPDVRATVAASTGTVPTGRVRLEIDGSVVADSSGPTVVANRVPSTVGTHSVKAEFFGDSAHPPSRAAATYEIVKQTPEIGGTTTVYGSSRSFTVQLRWNGSYGAAGTVSLTYGTTNVGEVALSNGYASFTLPPLQPGRYFVRAAYSGDQNYHPVEAVLTFNVLSSAGGVMDARGTAAGVTVTWYAPGMGLVARKRGAEPWANAVRTCCLAQPWVDASAAHETVYLYRPESSDGTWSDHVDVGMRISFTDDPLLPGMGIRAVHLQEIVRAVNIVRAAASLPAVSAGSFAAGATIAGGPLNDLRMAVNEARLALGAVAYQFPHPISEGGPIHAAHIQDLREAIR